MKYFIWIIHLLLFPFSAVSQSINTDDGIKHWEADFSAGFNTDGYQFDFGFAYFPNDYLGIKTMIGFAGEIDEFFERDENWQLNENHYASRFKFNPSIILRTPRLYYFKSSDIGLYLFAEPGLIFSPGETGSKQARWLCWNVRSGINVQIDRIIVYAGYGISNFNLFSGYPTNLYNPPSNDNDITHSVFIGVGYKFGPTSKLKRTPNPRDFLF